MGKPRVPLDPVADLRTRLGREQPLRSCVRTWWTDHGLDTHPAQVGKRVAIALIEQPMVEQKLAGCLVLQDLLGSHLRATDLPTFARLFAAGHLAEWNVVDWFIMKVLVTLLDRANEWRPTGRRDVARQLAQWRNAETMWQRRAACLAFVKLAPQGEAALPGLVDHVLAICATVVWSNERYDQTAVGAVLRELARAEPDRVEAFFRRHALLMSKECARAATAKFPADKRAELIAVHKRATSLRHS